MESIKSDPVTKDAVALLHMGDIIQSGRNNDIPSSYAVARQGFDALGMPYVLNFGNNDEDMHYENTFPVGDYQNWPSFVGNRDGYKNHVHKFEAGGIQWLVVSLRHNADGSEEDWARNHIGQHQAPDHRVILINHSATVDNSAGLLARDFNNVVLLLSGHSASDIRTFTVKDNNKAGWIKTCWHN